MFVVPTCLTQGAAGREDWRTRSVNHSWGRGMLSPHRFSLVAVCSDIVGEMDVRLACSLSYRYTKLKVKDCCKTHCLLLCSLSERVSEAGKL